MIISWTSPNIQYVDISTSPGFSPNSYYTKTVSGNNTTAPDGFMYSWYSLTLDPDTIYYVRLRNSSGQISDNASFSIVKCKFCSVSLPASSRPPGSSVTATLYGQRPIAPSTEPANLWVERVDGGLISPAPGTKSVYNGINYYLLGTCQTDKNNSCSFSSPGLTLPVGKYYFHCDIPNNVPHNVPPPQCSGNPFCNGNEIGGIDCSIWGFVPCSYTDAAPFSVNVGPWIQAVGDVHSNGRINAPGGP